MRELLQKAPGNVGSIKRTIKRPPEKGGGKGVKMTVAIVSIITFVVGCFLRRMFFDD